MIIKVSLMFSANFDSSKVNKLLFLLATLIKTFFFNRGLNLAVVYMDTRVNGSSKNWSWFFFEISEFGVPSVIFVRRAYEVIFPNWVSPDIQVFFVIKKFIT